MSYSTDQEGIECPHCGNTWADANSDWYPSDNDIYEVKCEDCGKSFTITASMSFTYETQCGTEEKDECEFIAYKFNDSGDYKYADIGLKEIEPVVWAICRKCDNSRYVKISELAEPLEGGEQK